MFYGVHFMPQHVIIQVVRCEIRYDSFATILSMHNDYARTTGFDIRRAISACRYWLAWKVTEILRMVK